MVVQDQSQHRQAVTPANHRRSRGAHRRRHPARL